MTVRAFAPAKINLTLHVTGQRVDGYHLLDSLVIFADVGDRLEVTPADRIGLEVEGPKAPGVPTDARNLVWQVAELMGIAAKITIAKNLPSAAGIGGGSSDAAAALLALQQIAGRSLPTDEALMRLGADVPLCLQRGLLRMRGVGEELTRVGPTPDWPLLLVNPGIAVPTPEVFARLDNRRNAPMEDPVPGSAFLEWLCRQRNDLQRPAITCAPVIEDVLAALRDQPGCELARMSGSGATCFAIMQDKAKQTAALERLRTAHPDWWSVACRPCDGVQLSRATT